VIRSVEDLPRVELQLDVSFPLVTTEDGIEEVQDEMSLMCLADRFTNDMMAWAHLWRKVYIIKVQDGMLKQRLGARYSVGVQPGPDGSAMQAVSHGSCRTNGTKGDDEIQWLMIVRLVHCMERCWIVTEPPHTPA